jgi:hypothetical protein
MTPFPRGVRRLYRRWIVANGWSEALGLGTTLLVGMATASWLERAGAGGLLLGAAGAVALGTLLEGVVVGVAQERVLRDVLPGLRARVWTIATALGAGLAWLIGMLPSTILALVAPAGGTAAPVEPSPAVQYSLAAALGLVTGPILGFAQWLVLRRQVPRAGRWLWANAGAWAVGMPVIFLGMDLVPWSRGGVALVAAIYAVAGAAGAVVGAIHGLVLLRLVMRPPPTWTGGGHRGPPARARG